MAKSKLTPIIETGTDTEVVLAGNVIADDESSDVGVAGGAVMGDAVTCGMVSQFIVGDGGSTSSLIFLATRSSFPALGSSTSFYIDMEKEVIYRWSEDTAEYRVVGENLSNITKIIVGVTPGFVSGTLTAAQILLRGMTAVEWNTTDPVLVDGEIGIEKGTCQFKIGDGTNKWSELDYIGAIPDSYVTKTDYAKETEGGVVISSTAINTISVGIDGTMTINTIGGDKITSVLSVEVIPELSWSKITSGKPTTLSGYGITDATPSSHIGSGGTEHAVATELESGFISSYSQKKINDIEAGAEVNIIEVIKKNGSALSVTDKAVDIAIPTKTSEILNDSNFPSDASYVHTDNNYTTAEKTKMTGIEVGAEVNNISDSDASDLTDGTDSTLHFHSTDRNRANHTGTQTASTISDFATAALTAAPAETTTTIGTLINGATAKTTPVDADLFVMSDSAASYIAKKVTLANLKTVLGGVLAPAAHTHGNITNAGAIGTTATLPIITGTSGVLQVGSFGTTAGTFCQGSDSRLSDARTPLAHNQASSTITDFATAVSTNTDVAASTTARHTHSNKTIVDNITAAYTTAEQTKLSGIAAGAEVNVNADWTAGSGDAQIINKPTTLSSLGVTDIYTKTEVDSLISSSGGGDMMKATYDVTNNGIVDNSEKLGGKSPAYYTNTAIAMAIALS